MNLNLRQAIIDRVKGKSEEELYEVIQGSVGGDDRTLPGLGVLFEIIWQNSESDMQHTLISTLQARLQSP